MARLIHFRCDVPVLVRACVQVRMSPPINSVAHTIAYLYWSVALNGPADAVTRPTRIPSVR